LWSSLPATMNREVAPTQRPIMRKLITTIALLALVGTSVAIAQRAGSSTNPDMQLLADAPVGHRQPRADQVPSDKMDPNGIMVLKGLTLPPRE
jgi:hypothetical protein